MGSMEEVCKVSCYNRPQGFWWFSYIGNDTDKNCIKVDIPFNFLMAESFEDGNTQELMQRLFVQYMKH